MSKPVSYRSRFGDPDAPLWGQDMLLYSKKDIERAIAKTAKKDHDAQTVASDFAEYWRSSGHHGISDTGALELIAKVGWLLNEVEGAK